MRKVLQSPVSTFVTIAGAWIVVGGVLFVSASVAAMMCMDSEGSGFHPIRTMRLCDQIIGLSMATAFPFCGDRDLPSMCFPLAGLFWAGVVTAVLWVPRALFEHLRHG